MFQKILVPTDLTDRTIKALDVALSVAASDTSHITLLHVIETIAGTEDEELANFYRRLEQRALDRLNEIVRRAAGRHPHIDIEVTYGKRAEEVLRFAREKQVDLIVLASHPLDPSQPRASLGTMSYKLGVLAPCSVLLVK
jgi:nucleotide-binding universal stress UspA family protein